MTHPDLSVVIPTRNRRASLERTLNALARQRLAANRFEAVVSMDGADEAGTRYLAAMNLPYHLTVVGSDAPRGAAAARNLGAASAQGELLLFLDDDVEADPGLLAEHVRAQHDGAHVTIGYLPPCLESGPADFFQRALRGWWEAMFDAMRLPGHRYWFRDFLTGNCAMSATLFERVGRFDEDFRCHEDYEFGVRVVADRAAMRFVEAASGIHHEQTTVSRAFERKREEGRADIQMLRKHPELVPSLPLGIFDAFSTRMQRLLRRLAFERPSAGRTLASLLARSLPLLESGRFRGRWMKRMHALLSYWYWRGITEEIPTLAGFAAFLRDCRSRSGWSPMILEVDLANGLELVKAQIDRRRPEGLRVVLNGVAVGDIAPVPGAEGLTGHHLEASLARELSGPLVAALGRSGAIPVDSADGAWIATGRVPSDSIRF